jgi:CO/xanthine dehydrogenase FAD-binding subunit
VTEARIAVGCVASTPRRAPEAEALLVGHAPDAGRLRAVGEAVAAVADPVLDSRGSPAYKQRVTPVIVQRAIRQAWAAAPGARP